MAISYINWYTWSAEWFGFGTQLSITISSAPAEWDLLLLHVWMWFGNDISTNLSGWTKIADVDNSPVNYVVFYRAALGNETAVTVFGPPFCPMVWLLQIYRWVDTDYPPDPIDVTLVSSTWTSWNVWYSTWITPITSWARVVASWASNSTGRSAWVPTGYSNKTYEELSWYDYQISIASSSKSWWWWTETPWSWTDFGWTWLSTLIALKPAYVEPPAWINQSSFLMFM